MIALLSVDSVLYCPTRHRDKAAATHLKFHSPYGDHMTLLAIYLAYCATHGKKVSDIHCNTSGYCSSTQSWCREYFIHQRNMHTALNVRAQLVELCSRHGVAQVSNRDSCAMRRALLVGLHTQTAEHVGEGKYRTVCHMG